MADWIRIALECSRDEAAALEDAMGATGAIAVTLEDAGNEPKIEAWPPAAPLWSSVRVTGLYPGDVNALPRLVPHVSPGVLARARVSTLGNEDWVRSTRERVRPMRFGGRLWVSPAWLELPEEAEHATVVRLDPGLAFGTGSHPTTALCLERLAGKDLNGLRMIDYGCGSGILGIAALRLGASSCLAVDVDPRALKTARENAERNRVADRFRAVDADSVDKAGAGAESLAADVLAANIVAETLAACAPTFRDLVVPGGELMLAGILEDQAEELLARYASWFRSTRVAGRDGWCLLVGTRLAARSPRFSSRECQDAAVAGRTDRKTPKS